MQSLGVIVFLAPSPTPLQLPRGVFFICGDRRSWPAIPPNTKGGPCSIGRLALLTPSVNMIKDHKHQGKRFIHQYESDCKDDFEPWGCHHWDMPASTVSFGSRGTDGVCLPLDVQLTVLLHS